MDLESNCIVVQTFLNIAPKSRALVHYCRASQVIRDLESIDHLYINPILRIGLIHK